MFNKYKEEKEKKCPRRVLKIHHINYIFKMLLIILKRSKYIEALVVAEKLVY